MKLVLSSSQTEKVYNKFDPSQLYLNSTELVLLFHLNIRNGRLQNLRSYYLFQLVSLMVSHFRKKARNKKRTFPLDRKSLSTTGNKSFSKTRAFISFSFHITENSLPPSQMENSLKVCFKNMDTTSSCIVDNTELQTLILASIQTLKQNNKKMWDRRSFPTCVRICG